MRGFVWIVHYSIGIAKLLGVLMVALFLPQLFLWHNQQHDQQVVNTHAAKFKLGLEVFTPQFFNDVVPEKQIKARIALITNQTGTDQQGVPNHEILRSQGLLIKKIFMPQGSFINDKAITTNKSVPIIAFESTKIAKPFTKKNLHDVDVLIFDMQDCGMRYYGFVTTLLDAMDSAAQLNKKFIVFDRPNLLGWCMEGMSPLQKLQKNCADSDSVPMRYGMTVGELAAYFNKYVLAKPVNLHVVPMEHYNRQTEVRQVLMSSLSNNLTCIDACYGYSFLGALAQVGPFDIGLTTEKAFQCIMLPDEIKLPKKRWHELQVMLQEYGIASKPYRYVSSKNKQSMSGLRIWINDINRFSSCNTLIAVLQFFKESGVELKFSDQFDASMGSSKIRLLSQGTISRDEVAKEMNGQLQGFFKRAFSCFLYKPFPKMMHV